MSIESQIDNAVEALANRIEEIDDDITAMQGQIEDLECQIGSAEDRKAELTHKMRRLKAMDERVVEQIVTGSKIIKTPRMLQIEKTPTRGLSWDELRRVNAEYESLAKAATQDIADAIEEAIAS